MAQTCNLPAVAASRGVQQKSGRKKGLVQALQSYVPLDVNKMCTLAILLDGNLLGKLHQSNLCIKVTDGNLKLWPLLTGCCYSQDYYEIVQKPMDLSTIKRKLDRGQYRDPWEYVDDVWLMFDNAWVYNKKSSRVYKYCTKLSEVFEQEINSVMQSLGYCCGIKQSFSPQVLCCSGSQQCFIPQNATFFHIEIVSDSHETDQSDQYRLCEKCFLKISGDFVEIKRKSSQTELQHVVPKDQFVKTKNNHAVLEPLVVCEECRRKFHNICVLHFEPIWNTGFICENCLKAKGAKRKDNKYCAKRLPDSKLGNHLENRINTFLKKKDAGAGKVSIKVLSCSEKFIEVRPEMKAKFTEKEEFPEKFTYTAKSVFAFETLDGSDVCFFGMQVQEYDSECAQPNTRRVYISYLDSVHFFQPRQLRTAVYHEILIGYLQYVKSLGYAWAHIWVCPPVKGDDYILNCHPKAQKTPNARRLLEWYKKMLDKALAEGVVSRYEDIFTDFKNNKMLGLTELPYFDGDFWPRVLEDLIKETDLEREKRNRRLKSYRLPEEGCDCCSAFAEDRYQSSIQIGQSSRKNTLKDSSNKRKSLSETGDITDDNRELEAKLLSSIERHREGFVVVCLHSAEQAVRLPPIHDPDPCINCDLMAERDAILTFMRDGHYEFSSLRRAKYSTIALLYELRNRGLYTRDTFKAKKERGSDSSVCVDSVVHNKCSDRNVDDQKISFDDGNDCLTPDQQASEKSAPQIVQRCVQWLTHACYCREPICDLAGCYKMKAAVSRAGVCKKTSCQGCPSCRLLVTLCCVHAKYCTEATCPVPFCPQIVQKLQSLLLQKEW